MILGTTAGTFQLYCYQDANDKWDVQIADEQGNVSNGPSDLKNNSDVQLQIDSAGNVTISAA